MKFVLLIPPFLIFTTAMIGSFLSLALVPILLLATGPVLALFFLARFLIVTPLAKQIRNSQLVIRDQRFVLKKAAATT